jgi:multiple sugar transport system substrate-binding protein
MIRWGRRWASGLCLTAAAAVLAAAGATAAKAPAKVDITVWNYATGYEAQAFETEVNLFNRSQSAIHVSFLGGVSEQKVDTAIAGGTPPNLVDDGGGVSMMTLAAQGALLNLTPYLKRDHVNLAQFVPSSLETITYKGKIYGLPGGFDGNFLYYNKKLFKAAGIASPPKTFAQLWADAKKLTVIRNGKIVQAGFVPNGGLGFAETGLQLWAYEFGGNWWNPKTGQLTPLDPGNLEALTWETSFYKQYGFKRLNTFNASSFGSGPLGSDPFAFGKVAMENGGEWLRDFLNHYAPSIDYGETTLPVQKIGDKPQEFINADLWVIPARASHIQATLKFLLWLDRPSIYQPILNKMINLPQFTSLYDHPNWAVPGLRVSIELQSKYTVHGIPEVANLTQYETGIADAEQNATYGRMSPRAALQQLANQFAHGAPVP